MPLIDEQTWLFIACAFYLLAAVIDNNIQSKTDGLGLDPRTISWKRVVDMNDRSLRRIIVGLGGTTSGVPRETGFDITAASEIMAILCLAADIHDHGFIIHQ